MSFTETVWSFETARFRVELQISEDAGYRYDGDDEDGSTQESLDSGELIAFDSRVVVTLDGREVGFDSLGGSVYAPANAPDFWQAHRTSSADYRNTLAMKEKRICICQRSWHSESQRILLDRLSGHVATEAGKSLRL